LLFDCVLYGLEFKNPRFRRISLIIDGSDATRRAIGAADDHPLSVPALTRQAIKRLQRTAAPASKLACSSAADPQRR
jgi:hypothetical protein